MNIEFLEKHQKTSLEKAKILLSNFQMKICSPKEFSIGLEKQPWELILSVPHRVIMIGSLKS